MSTEFDSSRSYAPTFRNSLTYFSSLRGRLSHHGRGVIDEQIRNVLAFDSQNEQLSAIVFWVCALRSAESKRQKNRRCMLLTTISAQLSVFVLWHPRILEQRRQLDTSDLHKCLIPPSSHPRPHAWGITPFARRKTKAQHYIMHWTEAIQTKDSVLSGIHTQVVVHRDVVWRRSLPESMTAERNTTFECPISCLPNVVRIGNQRHGFLNAYNNEDLRPQNQVINNREHLISGATGDVWCSRSASSSASWRESECVVCMVMMSRTIRDVMNAMFTYSHVELFVCTNVFRAASVSTYKFCHALSLTRSHCSLSSSVMSPSIRWCRLAVTSRLDIVSLLLYI